VIGLPNRVLYATPKGFDRALTHRIALAAATLPYSVAQLRRQFAYGRLLTRVFLHAPERWVLKGATSLLNESEVRHTTIRHFCMTVAGGTSTFEGALARQSPCSEGG